MLWSREWARASWARGSLERGGESPEGVPSPRASRRITRGGAESSSEAEFQQKCLLSFKKNRSGVPYLKNEMPRVLLPGEIDATTLQEREECMQAF
jgi:transposase-like protein